MTRIKKIKFFEVDEKTGEAEDINDGYEKFREDPCCDRMERELMGARIAINVEGDSYEVTFLLRSGGELEDIHFCPWCGSELQITAQQRW